MVASQDFRDGAAYGALELARRLKVVSFFGFPLSTHNIELAAKEIQQIMGGAIPDLADTPAEEMSLRRSSETP
jgi:hypothetical protein